MIHPRATPSSPLLPGTSPEFFQTAHGKLIVVTAAAVLAVLVAAFTEAPRSWIVVAVGVLAAAVAAVPRVAPLAMPVIAYAGIWLGFNLVRARANGTAWTDAMLGYVARLEALLFDGALPSAVLQERYFTRSLAWYDYGLAAVYLSFFIVPHLVALLLLWRQRRLFWRSVLALAFLFGLALVGYYALPTAPPWLITDIVPEEGFTQIERVVPIVARQLELPVALYNRGLRGSVLVSEVRFEPNPVAAMPSIHFAVTALFVFLAWRIHRGLGLAALVYTLLMGAALVYLGEHYVLDLVAGWLLLVLGWIAADRLLKHLQKDAPP